MIKLVIIIIIIVKVQPMIVRTTNCKHFLQMKNSRPFNHDEIDVKGLVHHLVVTHVIVIQTFYILCKLQTRAINVLKVKCNSSIKIANGQAEHIVCSNASAHLTHMNMSMVRFSLVRRHCIFVPHTWVPSTSYVLYFQAVYFR